MISKGGFGVLGELGENAYDVREALERVKLKQKSAAKGSSNDGSSSSSNDHVAYGERYGDDDLDDFQVVKKKEKNARPKTALCRYFVQGVCTRGSSCPFAHSIGQLNSNPRGHASLTEKEVEEAKNHPLYKTEMCRYFPSKTCQKGNDCPFAHSKAELRPKPALEDSMSRHRHGPGTAHKTPRGPNLDDRLDEISECLENCHKCLYWERFIEAQTWLREARIELLGNTSMLSPEKSMRASVLQARYEDLSRQTTEAYNNYCSKKAADTSQDAGTRQIREELLKVIKRAASSGDLERLSASMYELKPPITEEELGSLMWECCVTTCNFKTVKILVKHWKGDDWTKLTVDAGLEGKKCLIHEMVLKAMNTQDREDDAKGIISLMLQHRPTAVLDLYQGTTPLMLAIRKKADICTLSLLTPTSVPEALEIKSGIPPRSGIEEAQRLSQAVGMCDEVRNHYQNVYSFLLGKREDLKRRGGSK